MEEFSICLEGTWYFNYLIKANSREEAINQAIKDMDAESRCIELYHTNQWLEGEEEGLKKEIHIAHLESGSINRNHTLQ
jgi:hypothetical protein